MKYEIWQAFAKRYELSEHQQDQFVRYYNLLVERNKQYNLTTITEEEAVIDFHFADSLALAEFYPVSHSRGLLDIGTGAGFPGIPLKIKYPHIPLFLMEVTEKKQAFLQEVINELGLTDSTVVKVDWRTFLRQPAQYPIDLFCARASLRPDELLRLFKQSSPYREATLVYWASEGFMLEPDEKQHCFREEGYEVGARHRKFIFFRMKGSCFLYEDN